MNGSRSLRLFEGIGIELEYMIVNRRSLAVLPVADQLLAAQAGHLTDEVEAGPLRWSNELVLHVVELKTNGPAASLQGLADAFQQGVMAINRRLAPLDGRLMPTAMHPWMDPSRDGRLWPHDNSIIYQTYHRIFDCRGHGWVNLQSCHLNLPFCGDEEFGRLHAAIRLLLPILPALAASSPFMDSRPSGFLDTRLQVYRDNQKRIPLVTGRVIPEPVFTRRTYQEGILQPLYRAIADVDPEGILQEEWLNSRGAIARFERQTIEIRILDVQEAPIVDLAIAAAVTGTLKALVSQRWQPLSKQQDWPQEPLSSILFETIRDADRAIIDNSAYLAMFGIGRRRATAGELWRHIITTLAPERPDDLQPAMPFLENILTRGPLARRILRSLGDDPSLDKLAATYANLCQCLAEGKMYLPPCHC
jgi:gamma-glutamyl:cysteine ligase YbdK (ATP-grasp superfamily)